MACSGILLPTLAGAMGGGSISFHPHLARFIFQFISQITPYSQDPRYDLDMASSSLVKCYDDGRHGATYPDMT
ncbi:MAG: hypothetical protein ACLQEQ_01120 [Nitrososphaerales archaeon]